jgi:hypothetical protein
MSTHLILTVGTGTAGKTSNLEAGLRRTLELISPAAFWLIPSTDEVSTLMADMVRDGQAAFRPWSADTPYHSITAPDSLEICRRTVREVIQHVRKQLPRDARLLVNPTSGTKQMSAGATLAALDEGLGEIVFTVGQRADGVVMTGTERLEIFQAAGYFAERDLAIARNLATAGAFAAAAAVLRPHPALAAQAGIAACLHEWERQNYQDARRIAAGCDALAPWRRHLDALASAAKTPEPQPIVIADLLQTADLLHRRGESDASLVQSCRAVEMGLRRALFEKSGLAEPYALAAIRALPIDREIKDRCAMVSHDGTRTILNLNTVARILQQLGHDIGSLFFADGGLQGLIRVRNELMHSLRAATPAESQAAVQRARNLLAPLHLPAAGARPTLT